MRSELVFEAVHTLRNRYTLCQLASKATRKFHKSQHAHSRHDQRSTEPYCRVGAPGIILEPETAAEAQRRAA